MSPAVPPTSCEVNAFVLALTDAAAGTEDDPRLESGEVDAKATGRHRVHDLLGHHLLNGGASDINERGPAADRDGLSQLADSQSRRSRWRRTTR